MKFRQNLVKFQRNLQWTVLKFGAFSWKFAKKQQNSWRKFADFFRSESLLWKSVCGTCKCYSAPVVDYRRCLSLSLCRRRVPCTPVRSIVSSYCIPVSFAIFVKILPFRWGPVVSVFSHFLLAWFLRGFSQLFTRRIPKVQRNANLVDHLKNATKCAFFSLS